MKTIFSAIVLLTLFAVTSCSNPNIGKQYKFIEPNTKVDSDIGYLKIYTFNYAEKGIAWDDPVSDVYKYY
jgi:hypothetical protein